MPRPSKRQLVAGGTVLAGALALSVAATLVPTELGPATTAYVSRAQSGSVSARVMIASDATVVRGAKTAAAQRAHEIQLSAIAVRLAHEAHLAHLAHLGHLGHLAVLAQRAEEARLAAQERREAAARQAAQQRQEAAARQAAQRRAAAAREAAAAPSGSPEQIAQQLLDARGEGGQFSCLDSLWTRESSWNVYATNPNSGAYGIPQALPPAKMASAGPDWRTDAATQIRWGLSYIDSFYGSPCSAWSHEQAAGWY